MRKLLAIVLLLTLAFAVGCESSGGVSVGEAPSDSAVFAHAAVAAQSQ